MRQERPGAAAPWRAQVSRCIERRWLLGAVSVATLAVAVPAHADNASVPELVLACDTTLGPPLRAVAAAYANVTGTRVNVFPTSPGLIVPQLERQVQNDVVVTQRSIMDAALKAGVVAQGAVRGGWRNPVVVAVRRDAPAMPDGPIAACDPTPASDMDGRAILVQLGIPPARMLGVIDTDTVVALVLNGTARAGLMHMTDVRAHPELQVLNVLSDSVQPAIAYAAAVTRLARRPDPARLVDFLVGNQATGLLATLGLESAP